MPKIALLNVKGEKIKDIKLSDEVFGIEPNNQTIYDAVVLKQASMRQGTHKVKTRSEVSGGGRKPWRQKETGTCSSRIYPCTSLCWWWSSIWTYNRKKLYKKTK